MESAHVFGNISGGFCGISRKNLNFAGPRPREISEALKCVSLKYYCIIIVSVSRLLWLKCLIRKGIYKIETPVLKGLPCMDHIITEIPHVAGESSQIKTIITLPLVQLTCLTTLLS